MSWYVQPLFPPQALDLVGDEGRLAPLVVGPEKLDQLALGVSVKRFFSGRSMLFSITALAASRMRLVER